MHIILQCPLTFDLTGVSSSASASSSGDLEDDSEGSVGSATSAAPYEDHVDNCGGGGED